MKLNDAPMTTTGPYDQAFLEAHWMPFTGNRNFKAKPRLIASAKGVYYTDVDGRQILDGLSGLWCCGLGHARPELVEAAAQQMAELQSNTP